MNTQQQYEEAHKLATALMGCGWADTDYLVDKVAIMERLTDQTYDDIIEQAQDAGYEKIDCNILIGLTLDNIGQHIYDRAFEIAENEEIKKKIQDSRDNFSPFINSLDSWFSNEMDQLDMDNEEKTLDDLAKDFIAELQKTN